MTKQHSKNCLAAKARKRMAGPAPDYPPDIDYEAPVESWTFKNYLTGRINKLVLFHSRRRLGCFRVVANGREWTRCMGYDRLLRGTRKALAR